MTEEELKQNMANIDAATSIIRLTSIAVEMLVRIAAAQEAIVHFASADLDAQIEEVVKSRAEKLAAEMDADKSKRSFIGKR